MLQTATQTRSSTHGKFVWCELMTSDTEAAGKFYSAVIGWNVEEMKMPADAGGSDAEPGAGSEMPAMPPYFVLTLGEGDDRPGIGGMMHFPPDLEGSLPPNWTGYVAVDDVDATARQFSEMGGRIQRPPMDIPKIGRFAVVADPQGAVICIITPIPPENPPRQPAEGEVGTLGWRELAAEDGLEAFDFYTEVFGWTMDHDFDMGAMGVYRVFAHQGRPVGGMMTKPESLPMPCWNYYFNVEAIDAAVGRIEASGGKVVHGPMEVPDGAWIVHATDPQGAFFALVAPHR